MTNKYLVLWNHDGTINLESPTTKGTRRGRDNPLTLEELNERLLNEVNNGSSTELIICDENRTTIYAQYQKPYPNPFIFNPDEPISKDGYLGRLKLYLNKPELDNLISDYVNKTYGVDGKNIITTTNGAEVTLVQSKELIDNLKKKVSGLEI